MKIFILDKYTVITAVLLAALAAAVIPLTKNAVVVSSAAKELPIYNVLRSDKKISVTFDCAWGADDVDAIIAALKEQDCRATFFVLGTWAEKYPDAVKKLSAAGHEIANHSYNHAYYTRLSPEEMKADMDKCDKAITDILGQSSRLFRAPAGDYNSGVVAAVRSSGRYCIQWDADSLDYRDLSADEMEERIMSKVGGGSILLFHTGTKNTAAALPHILSKLRAEGYEFCPVGELICYDNYTIDPQGRQIPVAPTEN